MGLSGAELHVLGRTVVKVAKGAGEQGRYLQKLGIGPSVSYIAENLYHMERCTPIDDLYDPVSVACRAVRILRARVWTRPLTRLDGDDWIGPFSEWAHAQSVFDPMRLMPTMYTNVELRFAEHVMIHGDPTISNMMVAMRNDSEELLIADPIEPRGKVPGYPEVDVGKLLQSLVGWEHVVFGWLPPNPAQAKEIMASVVHFSGARVERCLFWLGVHALRIVPYATAAQNVPALRWALQTSQYVFTHIYREAPCELLTTLMVRSRELGRRYWPRIGTRE